MAAAPQLVHTTATRPYACTYSGPGDCPSCELAELGWEKGAEWLHEVRIDHPPNTVSSYRSCLRKYAAIFKAIRFDPDIELRADPIAYGLAENAYRLGLKHLKGSFIQKAIGAQRYNQSVVALRQYLLWRNRTDLRREPLNLYAIFEEAKKQKTPKNRRDFDPVEIWKRISAIDLKPTSADGFCINLRDAAYLAFMLATGVRPGHAANVPAGDVDLRRKEVHLPAFKQTADYDIPIQPEVLPLLKVWRSSALRSASTRFKDRGLFFHGPRGARISRNEQVAVVKRHHFRSGWKSRTNIPSTLNCLRPTYASWALNKGGANLGHVQVLLGHADPATTATHYARYDIKSIKSVIRRMRLKPARPRRAGNRRTTRGP